MTDLDPAAEKQLREDLLTQIDQGARRIGILGDGLVGRRLHVLCAERGIGEGDVLLCAVKGEADTGNPLRPAAAQLSDLRGWSADVLCVTADDQKQAVLRSALPFIDGCPRVLVAGYGHYRFSDQLFEREVAQLLVPSIANGYPNCLVHLYECLKNASRLGLSGDIVEFGTFRGGTSMFLARVAKALGQSWRVLTLDTFSGFPDRRSPLDMYDHPGTVFTDVDAVHRYFTGWPIELILGDIVETSSQLVDRPMVLSFVDTDNYSSARAALEVVTETTVLNGAIVLDHYTGVDRFRYTIGERMAAEEVLVSDRRYLNLHGTGVFLRQM